MNATAIGWIITAIIAWLLIYSFFVGYKRGLGKTFFRFCWIFVTAVILIFVTPLISSYLNSYDLSSLNLDIAGPVTKLSDIGVNILNSLNLGPEISESQVVITFAENFPIMILNVLLFVLLFYLTKWILYPLWAVIASKIFDKEKNKKKQYEKRVKNFKKKGMPIEEEIPVSVAVTNKRRGLGGILGLITGAFICALTFTPIVGINNIYQNVYAGVVVENKDGVETPYIEEVVENKEVLSYANSYEISVGKKILDYSGMSFLSNFLFDNMAVIEVNNEKVYLSNEVDFGIDFYNSVIKIQNFLQTTEPATKDSLDTFLTNVKELVFKVNNSKLIYVLGDEVLPRLADDYILENENFKVTIGGNDYTDLIRDSYRDSTKNSPIDVSSAQRQVNSIVDIAVLLNNNEILAPFYNGEISTIDEVMLELSKNLKDKKTFSSQLVDSLYNIDLLEGQYGKLIDGFIEELFINNNLGEFSSNVNVLNQNLKNELKTILENILIVIDNYVNSENYDFGLNTRQTLESAGKILNSAKSVLLSQTSYTSLVNYFKDEANKIVEKSFADLSQVVNQIINVENWENELRSLSSLYQSIISIVNSEEKITLDKVLSGESQDINNKIYDVGSSLQTIVASQNSSIITNKNIREIFSALFSKVDQDANIDASLKELINLDINGTLLKDVVLNNIWNNEQSSSSISDWGKEIEYTLKFISKANKTLLDFDKNRLGAVDNTELYELGQSIDEALLNTNLVVSQSVLRELFNNFILSDDSVLGTGANEILNIQIPLTSSSTTFVSVKDYMLNNIYDKTSNKTKINSWAVELENLKPLLVNEFDTSDLSSVGYILDELYESKILSRYIVNNVVAHYVDEETSKIAQEDLEQLASPISKIKQIILNESSEDRLYYGVEFENLLSLIDVVNKTYESSASYTAEQNKLIAIGSEFNKLSGYLGDEPSKILTKEVLNEFLTVYSDKYISDFIQTTGNDISFVNDAIHDNISSVTNYSLEIQELIELSKIVQLGGEFTEIGKSLDGLNKESKIVSAVVKELIVFFVEDKTQDISKTEYQTAINSIIDNIRNNTISKYETEFGYFDKIYNNIFNSSNLVLVGENSVGRSLDEVIGSSIIITKDIVDNLLATIVQDKINNSGSIAVDIKPIVSKIVNNIPDIAVRQYEIEFGYLDTLIQQIDTTSVDKEKLGEELDKIKGSSSLIKKENIDEIITFYFNDATKNYNSTEYVEIINNIRSNISNVKSYSSLFSEIDILLTSIDNVKNISTLEEFKTSDIGKQIDNISNLENISGEDTAYSVAKILIDNVKKIENNQNINDAIDALLANETYRFETYNTSQWNGTYQGSSYYNDLMNDIIVVLNELQNP